MSIHVRFGAMYTGKTTYLMRLIETKGRAKKVLYINHVVDNRSEGAISTHSDLTDTEALKKYADAIKVSSLKDITDEMVHPYRVVCIDEAQFFTELKGPILHLVEDLGKEVHVVALNGDFKRCRFGNVVDLFEVSDTFCTLESTTICEECINRGDGIENKAIHTHRKNQSNGNQLEIGASNYMPVCRSCYLKLNHQ